MYNDENSEILNKLNRLAKEAEHSISVLIAELNGKQVSADTVEHLKNFSNRLNQFYMGIEHQADFDQIVQHSGAVGTFLRAIVLSLGKSLGKSNNLIKLELDKIGKVSDEIKGLINERKVIFNEEELQNSRMSEMQQVRTMPEGEAKTAYESLVRSMKSLEEQFSNRESLLTGRLDKLRSLVDGMDENAKEKIGVVNSLYENATESLEQKQKEVDDLLGTISAGVMAGDFEKTAKERL